MGWIDPTRTVPAYLLYGALSHLMLLVFGVAFGYAVLRSRRVNFRTIEPRRFTLQQIISYLRIEPRPTPRSMDSRRAVRRRVFAGP